MPRKIKKHNICLGDQVNVIDTGCIYQKYELFAERCQLMNWAKDKSLKNEWAFKVKTEYTVTNIERHHPNSDKMLAVIKHNQTGLQYIIGLEGIKLSEKHKIILEDDLFEL